MGIEGSTFRDERLNFLVLQFTQILLIDKTVSVPRFPILHINDSLIHFLHRTSLNPSVNLLFCRQLEHLTDILGTSNGGPPDRHIVHEKRKDGERRKRLFRSSNHDQFPTRLEHSQIPKNSISAEFAVHTSPH